MCSSHQHQFSVASRLRLTTQKMAKNFMMTPKEGHLKLTWITHKIFSLVLVHLKMQDIRHHYFSLRPSNQQHGFPVPYLNSSVFIAKRKVHWYFMHMYTAKMILM